jgi:hypothetical protein
MMDVQLYSHKQACCIHVLFIRAHFQISVLIICVDVTVDRISTRCATTSDGPVLCVHLLLCLQAP